MNSETRAKAQDLIHRLFSSDEANTLTNRAARVLEAVCDNDDLQPEEKAILDELANELFASDEASVLTNQAARMLQDISAGVADRKANAPSMTRADCLDVLIDAVKNGRDDLPTQTVVAALETKQTQDAGIALPSIYRWVVSRDTRAMGGVLDLFEMLFGKAAQYSIVTDPTCLKATVCWWPKGLSCIDHQIMDHEWSEDDAAKAFFLAILKVLKKHESHVGEEETV